MNHPTRRRRFFMGRFLYLRLALLAALLIAVLVLHVHGKDLAILRVARIVIVVLVLLVAGGLRARRNRLS